MEAYVGLLAALAYNTQDGTQYVELVRCVEKNKSGWLTFQEIGKATLNAGRTEIVKYLDLEGSGRAYFIKMRRVKDACGVMNPDGSLAHRHIQHHGGIYKHLAFGNAVEYLEIQPSFLELCRAAPQAPPPAVPSGT